MLVRKAARSVGSMLVVVLPRVWPRRSVNWCRRSAMSRAVTRVVDVVVIAARPGVVGDLAIVVDELIDVLVERLS